MSTLMNRYGQAPDVSSLHDEVNRMFREAFGQQGPASAGAFTPALDVEEDDERFILHVELPSVAVEDVEVSLEENVLTIAGERRFYDDRTADGFRRIERNFGRFHRAVRLPDRVAPDQVEATHRDGLLTITVPKAEEAKPRRIQIQAG